MSTDLSLKGHGIEDAGFEAPRREIPAEFAAQQNCACAYECYRMCKGGCGAECYWNCAGNPTLQSTLYSPGWSAERAYESGWLSESIFEG